jgi:maleylpyruvate isomerase
LNLKGLKPDYVGIDLRTEEHLKASFKSINPQGFVPVLDIGGEVLTQSPAIIEWLEETYPTPALLPHQTQSRAYVRALAAVVGCDIHPINNRRILEYLRKNLNLSEEQINKWCSNWIVDGFNAYEALLNKDKNRLNFSYGDTPTLTDVYLIPQIESARRFKVDLSQWPLIASIETACLQLDAFKDAAPMQQLDAS